MELTDLHVHSTASDGTFTPSELVAEAKKIGLKAFALTDHDTVAGVKEATAAADEAGIELIPGIEISTKYNSTYIKDGSSTLVQPGLRHLFNLKLLTSRRNAVFFCQIFLNCMLCGVVFYVIIKYEDLV